MQRLKGGDAVYLYQETPSAPQHTLKISIMRSKHPQGEREQVKRFFRATIHRIPALRWRILPVPFGLHHPVDRVKNGHIIAFGYQEYRSRIADRSRPAAHNDMFGVLMQELFPAGSRH